MKKLPDAGFRGIPTVELVSILVGEGIHVSKEREEKARRLITAASNLRNLSETSVEQLVKHLDLSREEAIRVAAAIELGRRSALAGKGELTTISGPEDVFRLLDYLRHEKREHFVAILLDTKMNVMRIATIHIGSLDMSLVGAREVFREAIRDGAAQIIVSHNHPSGDPTPSTEDIEVTGKLVEVGHMLDIPVLDHIIIGELEPKSLKRLRLM